MRDIEKEVIELVERLLNAKNVTLESSLMLDLQADSLEAMEVLLEVEDYFDISIDSKDVGDCETTVGRIVEVVKQELQEKTQ